MVLSSEPLITLLFEESGPAGLQLVAVLHGAVGLPGDQVLCAELAPRVDGRDAVPDPLLLPSDDPTVLQNGRSYSICIDSCLC